MLPKLSQRLLALLALSSSLGYPVGCVEDEPNCLMVPPLVYVEDQNGAPICDVTVTASDGSNEVGLEQLTKPAGSAGSGPGPCNLYYFPDRADSYTVHVSAPGYSSAEVAVIIRKDGDGCYFINRADGQRNFANGVVVTLEPL